MISGSRKLGLHDYINTKLGLTQATLRAPRALPEDPGESLPKPSGIDATDRWSFVGEGVLKSDPGGGGPPLGPPGVMTNS